MPRFAEFTVEAILRVTCGSYTEVYPVNTSARSPAVLGRSTDLMHG
jgi:hypothetical protein